MVIKGYIDHEALGRLTLTDRGRAALKGTVGLTPLAKRDRPRKTSQAL